MAESSSLADTESVESCCTIGITTRNRPEALAETLKMLAAVGLAGLRYIILDDGSHDPERTRASAAGVRRCRFISHERCVGLVRSRNEMMQCCETAILISLDDDAHIADAQGLPQAVSRMVADPTIGLVSFRLVHVQDGRAWTTGYCAGELPYFKGGAGMLSTAAFRAVGGYPDILFYGAEETHLVYQLFRAGFRMIHAPSITVVHSWHAGARQRSSMEYHFSRSQAIVKILNLPLGVASASIGCQLLRRCLDIACVAWLPCHLTGAVNGLLVGLWSRRASRALTWREWRVLRRLLSEVTINSRISVPSQSVSHWYRGL